MEGDPCCGRSRATSAAFQSTPSAWRETPNTKITLSPVIDFNPLPPHGGRLLHVVRSRTLVCISIHSLRMEGDVPCRGLAALRVTFQSTPSAWRETTPFVQPTVITVYFNPLPPHGGRQCNYGGNYGIWQFQSTPSAWRETCRSCW